MKERTAAYIRVSTQEQKLHGYSLDAQREALKHYAEAHDLEIVNWYEDEGISGRKEVRKRPSLQRMMQDAEQELFARIIFIKLDRYFRSVGEYYACQKILDKHNILWSATNEDYDLTTATGRLLVSQKLAIAEYEADNTSERIKLVNEYKIRQGNVVYGTHSLHIGFMVANTSEGKKVVHDPDKEHIARDIIDTFVRTNSLTETARQINDRHELTFSPTGIKRFLRDTKLYGSYRGNESYCEPYITKEEFDSIQAILNRNIKATPSRRVYIFSGLIKCPECRNNLSSATNGIKVKYYRCSRAVFRGGCHFNKMLSENTMERKLLDSLNQIVGKYITEVETVQIKNSQIDASPVKTEIQRLNKMYQKGRITEREYDREYSILSAKLREIEKRNENVENHDISKYKDLLNSDWKEEYYALDEKNKQAFWRGIVREIYITEDREICDIVFF